MVIMMRKLKNKGTCKLCDQVFDHEVIENHFNNCIEKNISDEQKTGSLVKIFRIKIFSGEKYWKYIDIVDVALLKDLDNF